MSQTVEALVESFVVSEFARRSASAQTRLSESRIVHRRGRAALGRTRREPRRSHMDATGLVAVAGRLIGRVVSRYAANVRPHQPLPGSPGEAVGGRLRLDAYGQQPVARPSDLRVGGELSCCCRRAPRRGAGCDVETASPTAQRCPWASNGRCRQVAAPTPGQVAAAAMRVLECAAVNLATPPPPPLRRLVPDGRPRGCANSLLPR